MILFLIFVIFQFGSMISTGLLLYNSKKNGGIYCSNRSFFMLIFFWMFTLIFLLSLAVYYIKHVYNMPRVNLLINNIAVILWVFAVIGSAFLGSVALRSTKNNCFQMSAIDNILASITFISTGIAFLVFDYIVIGRIWDSGREEKLEENEYNIEMEEIPKISKSKSKSRSRGRRSSYSRSPPPRMMDDDEEDEDLAERIRNIKRV
jgi:hypothetical protein